jgi:hypothetical protein
MALQFSLTLIISLIYKIIYEKAFKKVYFFAFPPSSFPIVKKFHPKFDAPSHK